MVYSLLLRVHSTKEQGRGCVCVFAAFWAPDVALVIFEMVVMVQLKGGEGT